MGLFLSATAKAYRNRAKRQPVSSEYPEGYTPIEKRKAGLWQGLKSGGVNLLKFLDNLNRLGYGTTTTLYDLFGGEPGFKPLHSFTQGFLKKDEKTFGDFLGDIVGWQPEGTAGKVAKFGAGLAGDIALDPISYFSTGGSKILGKTGKPLGKGLKLHVPGTCLYKPLTHGKIVPKIAKAAGITKAVEAFKTSRAGEKMIDVFGSSYARKAGTPKKPWEEFTKLAREYEGTIPYRKQELADLITGQVAGARKAGIKLTPELERAMFMAKEATGMPEKYAKFPEALGEITKLPKKLKGEVEAWQEITDKMWNVEKAIGGRKDYWPGYVPHVYPEEWFTKARKGAGGRMQRPLRAIEPAAQTRRIETLPEVEKLVQANKLTKPETGFHKLMYLTGKRHIDYVETTKFINKTVDNFGTKLNWKRVKPPKGKPFWTLRDKGKHVFLKGHEGLYAPEGALKMFPVEGMVSVRKMEGILQNYVAAIKVATSKKTVRLVGEEVIRTTKETGKTIGKVGEITSKNIKKLESQIIESLTARGRTASEADQILRRIKDSVVAGGEGKAEDILREVTDVLSKEVKTSIIQETKLTRPAGLAKLISIDPKNIQEFMGVHTHTPIYKLPMQIADKLNNFVGSLERPSEVRKILGLWKSWVTMGRVGFLSRNFISINAPILGQGAMGWGFDFYKNIPHSVKALRNVKGAVKIAGKNVPYDEILKKARIHRVVSRHFVRTELADAAFQKIGKQSVLQKLNPFNIHNYWLEMGGKIGTAEENAGRLAGFIAELRRNGGKWADAAQVASKHFINYHEVPKAVKWARERYIPFITWLYQNTALQLELLARQPGMFAAAAKIKRGVEDISEPGEADKYMPEWMQEQYNVRLPGGKYLMPDFPLNELNLQTKKLLTGINPFIKIPIELLLNKEMFTGKPIDWSEGAGAYRRAPWWTAPATKVRSPEGRPMLPARTEFLLRQLPTTGIPKAIPGPGTGQTPYDTLAQLGGVRIKPEQEWWKKQSLWKEADRIKNMKQALKSKQGGKLTEEQQEFFRTIQRILSRQLKKK